MSALAPPSLDDLISAEEMKLTLLTRRLFALEAVLEDLERVTRGKRFRIWNSVTWMMLLDTRDAFVIHFASWARGMYKKGGFLRQVQAHGLRTLRRKWKRERERAAECHVQLQRHLKASHEASFARLFPGVLTPFVKPGDVDALRASFISQVDAVTADRDGNRAHPYESGAPRKMLDLGELRRHVSLAEAFLGDVRVVTLGSSSSFHDMNETSAKLAAAELVDLVLVDPLSRAKGLPAPRQRDRYYARLHTLHKSAIDREYFNAPSAENNAALHECETA